ncbi:MAG TPA: abscisic acid-deficient protein Aba4 family protein [Allosphingosinicella sp.]
MLDTAFLTAQGLQLAGLLALFAYPLIGRRRAVFIARMAAAVLALGYLFFFLPYATEIPRDMGYSLDAIAGAFETRELLLAGWIHYLVLDLFACSWEAEDAERSGVGYGALGFSMFVTAMVAPLGLLVYFFAARWRGNRRKA